MVLGLRNIDVQCVVKKDTESEMLRPDIMLDQSQIIAAESHQDQQDVTMDEIGNESLSPPTDHVDRISLKRFLYEIEDGRGENLIHAVYPSLDASKVYVLCSPHHKSSTLEKLQYIHDIVEQVYEPEAMEVYFKPHNKPYVMNHPVLTNDQEHFVNSLIDLTGSANPQEQQEALEMPQQFRQASYAETISTSPTKRQRNGFAKESNLPAGFSNNTGDAEVHAHLNETMARLKHIEGNEIKTQETLTTLSNRLDQQGADIYTLGQSLKTTNDKVDKVCTTQVQQGKTMVKMNESLNAILNQVSKLTAYNEQFSSVRAESSHGGEVDDL